LGFTSVARVPATFASFTTGFARGFFFAPRCPTRLAAFAGLTTDLAPGLAGVSTRLSFPIVICWCQGRLGWFQLARERARFCFGFHLGGPECLATFASFTTGFAPGLAGISTRLSFPIVICGCQGRAAWIQLARERARDGIEKALSGPTAAQLTTDS
jgi:hypothetical protein